MENAKEGSVIINKGPSRTGKATFVLVKEDDKLTWVSPNGSRIGNWGERIVNDSPDLLKQLEYYEGDGKPADIYIPKLKGKCEYDVKPDTVDEMPDEIRYGGHESSYNRGSGDAETAVFNYTMPGANCGAIKKASETGEGNKKIREQAKLIDEYCETAPQWNGGTLYRGVSSGDVDVRALKQACDYGDEISMRGISSWTNSEKTGKGYGKGGAVFICEDGTTHGTSIKGMSYYEEEDEVLISSKARYKIKDYETDPKTGVTYFNVIESNPREKSNNAKA